MSYTVCKACAFRCEEGGTGMMWQDGLGPYCIGCAPKRIVPRYPDKGLEAAREIDEGLVDRLANILEDVDNKTPDDGVMTTGSTGFKEFIREMDERDGRQARKDMVNSPEHYRKGGLEVIDIIECFELSYPLGNVIKYILRSNFKGKRIEDLRKAQYYLNRELDKEPHADSNNPGPRVPALEDEPEGFGD